MTMVLRPGWNLIGWSVEVSTAAAIETISSRITAVHAFDRASQSFRRLTPTAPNIANTLLTLSPGEGVFVHIAGMSEVAWEIPRPVESATLHLDPGFNLVAWASAGETVPSALLRFGDAVIAVFALDRVEQRYRVYRPGGPASANDLTTLVPGEAVWLQLRAAVEWTVSAPDRAGALRVIGSGCLNLRAAPRTESTPPLACLADGIEMESRGASTLDSGGREWLAVDVDGLVGWVAAEFVAWFDGPGPVAEPQDSTGSPALTPTFIWPAIGNLTDTFGVCTSPDCSQRHRGIDIDQFETPGAPVVAIAAGVVTFAGGAACCVLRPWILRRDRSRQWLG